MENKELTLDELLAEYIMTKSADLTPLEAIYLECDITAGNNRELLEFVYFMMKHPSMRADNKE